MLNIRIEAIQYSEIDTYIDIKTKDNNEKYFEKQKKKKRFGWFFFPSKT